MPGGSRSSVGGVGTRYLRWGLLLGALGSCARDPAPQDDPGTQGQPPAPSLGTALARDPTRGVPTLWVADAARPDASRFIARGVSAEGAAREHLERLRDLYGAPVGAAFAARVVRVHDTGRGGIIVVLRQSLGGIDVLHGDVKVLLRRDLELVAIGGSLHPDATTDAGPPAFRETAESAVTHALVHAHGAASAAGSAAALREGGRDAGGYIRFEPAPGAAIDFSRPVRVREVLFARGAELVPAYHVEIVSRLRGAADEVTLGLVVGADDGAILEASDLTQRETFDYRVWAHADGTPAMPLADISPHPTGTPDGNFPPFVAQRVISEEGFNENPDGLADPWLAVGATETRGNNVDAYTDGGADGFGAGDLRAAITAPATFSHPFDPSVDPLASTTQRMAAVTQLFYSNNWLHDAWYDVGFDESAGNAQQANFGRGGAEGDPIHAEAQDDAPNALNNANMFTPADGASPRMQMYLWRGRTESLLELGSIGEADFGVAGFGPTSFDVTAPGRLTVDNDFPLSDGCTAPVPDVAGRFLVVERGNCTFKLKAVNAEAAGAVGLVVIDNVVAPAPPAMGDGAPAVPVTIPLVSVTRAVGDTLLAALEDGTVSIHALRDPSAFADSDFDADIVAHEWGHYLHHRLTVCSNGICGGQSEGWGDFVALHTAVREGDDLEGTFGMGAYAGIARLDAAYFGIRRFPYTRDLARNGLTFRHIADSASPPPGPIQPNGAASSEVHNTGEVWASMLWQAYSNLLVEAIGPGTRYDFAEARRRMAGYVVAGMTLAPPNPDFTEQRDALLLAAQASDPLDARLLAAGFATRGAGSCAVSPPKSSTQNEGGVESFVVTSNLELVDWQLIEGDDSCDTDGYLDRGERGRLEVTLRNGGWGPMIGAAVSVSAGELIFPDGPAVAVPDLASFATTTVAIDVELDDSVSGSTAADLDITVSDPAGCILEATAGAPTFVESDEAPSFVDEVEARATTWSNSGTSDIWARERGLASGTAWRGLDTPAVTDARLESAPIAVGTGAPLTVSFSHRHAFESSNGTHWDAGVIEISSDDGSTWQDVISIAGIPYEGVVGGSSQLAGRPAFVARNPSYPARDVVSLDLGGGFAGDDVRLRFRLVTDGSVGAEAWEVDDIAVTGAEAAPFVGLVDDALGCGEGGSGGASGTGGDGTGGDAAPASTSVTGSGAGSGGSGGGSGGGGGQGGGAGADSGVGGGGDGGQGEGGGAGGHGGGTTSGDGASSGDGGHGDGPGSAVQTGSGTPAASGAATGATGASTGTGDLDGVIASGGGCDCRAAPRPTPPTVPALLGLGGLLWTMRKRRR